MSKLSNEQAILLDTLVYLNDSSVQANQTIGDRIRSFEESGWSILKENKD
ncbi:MAG: hypothetical protein Q3993_08920 [Filifactor alocis]|nr:hypothetical protein [Filifactor alocis]